MLECKKWYKKNCQENCVFFLIRRQKLSPVLSYSILSWNLISPIHAYQSTPNFLEKTNCSFFIFFKDSTQYPFCSPKSFLIFQSPHFLLYRLTYLYRYLYRFFYFWIHRIFLESALIHKINPSHPFYPSNPSHPFYPSCPIHSAHPFHPSIPFSTLYPPQFPYPLTSWFPFSLSPVLPRRSTTTFSSSHAYMDTHALALTCTHERVHVLGEESCDGAYFGPEVDRASNVVEEFAINLHR